MLMYSSHQPARTRLMGYKSLTRAEAVALRFGGTQIALQYVAYVRNNSNRNYKSASLHHQGRTRRVQEVASFRALAQKDKWVIDPWNMRSGYVVI